MKKFLSLLFLGSALAVRAANAPGDEKIFLDSDTNDSAPPAVAVTEWYITPEHLAKLPAYKPADEDPPLTLKAALAIAQAELRKHLTPQMTWSLDSVELHQIDAGNSGETSQESFFDKLTGKWFYKVIFTTERPDPKSGSYTEPYNVYVLMDGTIATRRDRPQTQHEIDEQNQIGNQIKASVLKDNAKEAK
jgi:hypothetical protein